MTIVACVRDKPTLIVAYCVFVDASDTGLRKDSEGIWSVVAMCTPHEIAPKKVKDK